jgi:pimeloyl-ACP methyl ester carboxylesterase
VEETRVAGNPTSVFVPAGEGPYPAVVFVNGAVLEGRRLPEVGRLGEGLARAGYLTVVPDLPGLTSDEITPRTLSATMDVALAVSERPDAYGGKVGLVRGSTGATLAILVAEDPKLAGRVRAVAGIAPYADIKTVLSVATTGHYELDGRISPYRAEPFLSYVVARSVISALPPGEDRERLLDEMRPIPRDSPDPLAPLRARRTDDLGPEARSIVALLANRDPGRFERLYRGLPEETRRSLRCLSPVAGAGRLRAPVELVTGPRDRYFPASESYELERVAPQRVVTVTGVLTHYMPRVSIRTLPEFVKLNNFAVRS